MIVVAWVLALLTAVIHLVVFVFEAFLIQRPAIHQGVFFVPAADVPAVRLWAFGVGFYNCFLALGLIAGVIAWAGGYETAGRTLLIYLCVFIALSGAVLLAADRLGLGRERGKGIGGALGQGIPPLLALLAIALAR
jgi:putative membrane protein